MIKAESIEDESNWSRDNGSYDTRLKRNMLGVIARPINIQFLNPPAYSEV